MIITYLNCTNGLDYINNGYDNIKFIRIQSTLLEAKKFDRIINELDYGFLIDIALGNTVFVMDGSTNKLESRALYQGIPWIEFVLNKNWFGREIKPMVKNHNSIEYFKEQYKNLSHDTCLKLKYVKNFLKQDLNKISIFRQCNKIEKEQNISYYIKKLQLNMEDV